MGREEPEDREEGPVLSPEELDIGDDEHVEQIGDGRYVVSPDVRPQPTANVETTTEREPEPEPERELTDAAVHEWLGASMDESTARYGFDVTAKFDGAVSQQRMMSNDIVTVFESLMLWYARQVDGDTPVEEVLGILLSESNVPVEYPPERLTQVVDSTDCSREDSVGELIAAIEDEGGVQL